MPTWNDLSQELESRRPIDGPAVLDKMRRERASALATHTGRPVVIYATDFLGGGLKAQLAGDDLQINLADKQGFIEVLENLPGTEVDLLIHSPGGSPLAAESIVTLLRTQFSHVRAFVPDVAKSAATMLALSANIIGMDERSELGPIDPQMIIRTESKITVSPAQAILEQFQMASGQIQADPSKLPVWLPLLQQYGPSLLVECRHAIDLSKELVRKWLCFYMLSGNADAEQLATSVAKFFSEHNNFHSHGRMVCLDTLPEAVAVEDLRKDAVLRDLVWQLYTMIRLTFQNTSAYKIIENSLGQAFIRSVQEVRIAPANRQSPAAAQQGSEPRGVPITSKPEAPTKHARKAQQSRGRRR